MTEPTSTDPNAGQLQRDADSLKATAQTEAQDARSRIEGLGSDIKNAAMGSTEQAREAATAQAERQIEKGASHIDTFASAIRSAADDLGEHDQSAAAQVVREAANGLQGLSNSLRERSVGEMVGSLAQFGRQNPTAFLGGALLAGVALGRFAMASSDQPSSSNTGPVRTGSVPMRTQPASYESGSLPGGSSGMSSGSSGMSQSGAGTTPGGFGGATPSSAGTVPSSSAGMMPSRDIEGMPLESGGRATPPTPGGSSASLGTGGATTGGTRDDLYGSSTSTDTITPIDAPRKGDDNGAA